MIVVGIIGIKKKNFEVNVKDFIIFLLRLRWIRNWFVISDVGCFIWYGDIFS